MWGSILIGLDYTADAAMALVIQRRQVGDPHAPYVERTIRESEQAWMPDNARAFAG